jgi:hypothetical protein
VLNNGLFLGVWLLSVDLRSHHHHVDLDDFALLVYGLWARTTDIHRRLLDYLLASRPLLQLVMLQLISRLLACLQIDLGLRHE